MSIRPVLYDLYCGAGGATAGYQLAGFDVLGVDIKRSPRYCGDRFVLMDALQFVSLCQAGEYPMPSAWAASPPCQGYSRMVFVTGKPGAPRLIDVTRDALRAAGRPYVIENVEMAKAHMKDYVLLCGTMFGLRIRRHRLFETQPILPILTTPCDCLNGVRDGRLIGHRLRGPKPPGRVVPPVFSERELRVAIGVEWMSSLETRDAIPPAYTAFIGGHLLAALAPRRDEGAG